MIARKLKACKVCGEQSYIFSHGLCKSCNYKSKPNNLIRKPLRASRRTTGERVIFLEIWAERARECVQCGIELGDEPNVFFFSHIKGKGAYPELRLVKSNIELLCAPCHIKHHS